jgi:hypothetical protein
MLNHSVRQRTLPLLAALVLIAAGEAAGVASPPGDPVVARRGQLAPVVESDLKVALFPRAEPKQRQLLDDAASARMIAEEILVTREWEQQKARYPVDSLEARYITHQQIVAAVKAGADIAEKRALESLAPGAIEARAREVWLQNPTTYMGEAEANVTVLQIDVSQRGFANANKRWSDIQKQIKRKVPFEQIAKEFTDDLKTTKSGRPVTFSVTESQADGDLYRAVFKTLQPGAISEPIATRQGLLIVRLNSRTPAVIRPFDDVKQEIGEKLLADVAKNARNEFLLSLKATQPEFLGRLADDAPVTAKRPAIDMARVLEESRVNGVVDQERLQAALRRAYEASVTSSIGTEADPAPVAPKQ